MENLIENEVVIENATKEIAEKINTIQPLTSEQWIMMTRSQRRDYLKKHTPYFKGKKLLPLNQKMELIKKNLQFGNIKQKVWRDEVISMGRAALVQREKSFRQLMIELNYSEDRIKKEIDHWYTIVIKDDSYMMENE